MIISYFCICFRLYSCNAALPLVCFPPFGATYAIGKAMKLHLRRMTQRSAELTPPSCGDSYLNDPSGDT